MTSELICFDLDGVFFTEQSFHIFKQKLAPQIDAEKRNEVLAFSPEMKAFKRGEMSENDFWDFAKKELQISLSIEKIGTIFQETYEIDEKVLAFIRHLRAKGYRVGACSNTFVTRIREVDKKYNFRQEFDICILSYEVGFLKPDVKIFEKLVEKSQVEPSKIIYADDKESRLQGAKSLGIQTFVFRDFETYIQDLEQAGIVV